MSFYLIILFLSEVFFNIYDYYLSSFLLLFFSIFIYFKKIKNKNIFIPKSFFLILIFFFIIFCFSFLFSLDKKNTLTQIINYLNLFILLIYSFNYKKEVKKNLINQLKLIYFLSIILFFINIIFFNKFFPSLSLLFYNHHNQIGNYFILPFILNLFNGLFFQLFLIFLIIISASRSAILSIIFLYVYRIIKNIFFKKPIRKDLLILLFLFLAFILVSNNFFNYFNIPFKKIDLLGNRIIYFKQAINYILKNPIFGVGLGNFNEISRQYSQNFSDWSISSHNFILDLIEENGILILIPILFFYYRLIKENIFFKKDNLLFESFLGLTFLFLMDFSFKFVFFKVIYVILIGVLIKDSKKDYFPVAKLNLILKITFLLFFFLILSEIAFNFRYKKLSLIFNPLNYHSLEEQIKNKDSFLFLEQSFLIKWYFWLKNDFEGEAFVYSRCFDKKTCYFHLQSLIYKYPAYYLEYFPTLIKFNQEIYGKIKYFRLEKILLNELRNKYFFKDKNSEVFKYIDYYCTRLIKC